MNATMTPLPPHDDASASACGQAQLIDGFGRRIHYLRVSVTDRCDLRCNYCMPKDFKGFEEPANWLSHAEMARLVGLFVQLGVNKVRLTGGKPLTRRGVVELAECIGSMPQVRDLSLSTNGTMLARHASGLKAAGVKRLNVSLDSLDALCVSRQLNSLGLLDLGIDPEIIFHLPKDFVSHIECRLQSIDISNGSNLNGSPDGIVVYQQVALLVL